MSEQLRRDMACEGLLECFHGLKELDKECFRVLVGAEDPLTVDEIADAVDRERSTAYRAVQRLLNDWYAKMGQRIREFEATYERSETGVPSTDR